MRDINTCCCFASALGSDVRANVVMVVLEVVVVLKIEQVAVIMMVMQ